MKFKYISKIWNAVKSFVVFDTYGNIASASFLICAISGIFLAIPFNIDEPYKSLSEIILLNPAASFFRNIHYWSAQIFLVFTFLHIWEHFKKNSENKIKTGIWLRLTISIFFTLFVMISGFILKADPDSVQAFLILSNLIEQMPLVGSTLASALIGSEGNFQILYMHHIATATIFLVIIIIEHAKTMWTQYKTFLISLLIISILSFFFTPYLHDGLNPVIKGPWYFVGLQEILHWFSSPVIIILFFLLLFVLFYFIKKHSNYSSSIKKFFFVFFWIYIFITIFAFFFRGENWQLINPFFVKYEFSENSFLNSDSTLILNTSVALINGRAEGCLLCHSEMNGFTDSHQPEALGCSSCHGGNPFSSEKTSAHAEMILIPGNLENAQRTCGTQDCHPDIIPRVNNSIMNTGSGMISVNKFVFDEIDLPAGYFNISALGHSASETHFRQLCASCHLGNEKVEYGGINELSRGGGCNACHLNYSVESEKELKEYISTKLNENKLPNLHPQLSINIESKHCFGCHSRSGRISTNYEGWHETRYLEDEIPDDGKEYRTLMDGRIFEFAKEDVHHKAGMECVDCHISAEIMGDGNLYQHKEEQLIVQCEDCHNSKPNIVAFKDFDSESKKISKLLGLADSSRHYLATNKGNYPLINTNIQKNGIKLITKRTQKELNINPPKVVCTGAEGHDNLSCSACHTSWAPQCVGCHTEYDESGKSFDLLAKEEVNGEWIENIGMFLAEAPTLGIVEEEGRKIVKTFIPGMVISLDKNSFDSELDTTFKRLFSPTFSHTIIKEARDCLSCHNSSLALGYGRGDLLFDKNKNKWEFFQKFADNKFDNLPEDAWIGFLSDNGKLISTRTNARAFNLEEQKRILTVGTCLTCHDGNSKVMKAAILDFQTTKKNISPNCLIPLFD